jgi:CDP-glycerol glycerophosphotransferase
MKRLSYLLKSSQILYNIYFYVISALLKLLGVFVGHDDNLILFNTFGGKKYDDSPKAIYEMMLTDSRFSGFKLVWALQEPEKVQIPGRATVIKADSFMYFVTALRAKVWITNSSMERGLDFKKKRTLCFNTWHGTPIKVMGIDIKEDNQSFRSKINVRADIILAQSQYDIDKYSHAFQMPASKFLLAGYPRNDVLANYTSEEASRIRDRLGIPEDKIVLLYAPTFREYKKGSQNEVVLEVPMNLQLWQDRLGDRYVVLFRAHYEVAKHMKVDNYPLFVDMSSYHCLDDLMIIADALISDYSSVFFDFSVTHKPMYCFAYDYDEYMANRGMYMSLKDELPCTVHYKEDSLLDELLKFNDDKEEKIKETIRFQQKYVTEYGSAAKKCCDEIARYLQNA